MCVYCDWDVFVVFEVFDFVWMFVFMMCGLGCFYDCVFLFGDWFVFGLEMCGLLVELFECFLNE